MKPTERLICTRKIALRDENVSFWTLGVIHGGTASGKTLALSAVIGTTVVWVSKDDGDTWVDESGDYTADNGGIAQWYENTLYVSSMGQGISSKTFAE